MIVRCPRCHATAYSNHGIPWCWACGEIYLRRLGQPFRRRAPFPRAQELWTAEEHAFLVEHLGDMNARAIGVALGRGEKAIMERIRVVLRVRKPYVRSAKSLAIERDKIAV